MAFKIHKIKQANYLNSFYYFKYTIICIGSIYLMYIKTKILLLIKIKSENDIP